MENQKTVVLSVIVSLYFYQFGRGRLNSGGDRRASLYGGGWKFFGILGIISRYISVTVEASPIIAANDY